MTTTPDPQTVREIAETAIRRSITVGRELAVERAILALGVPEPIITGTFTAYRDAAVAEYDRLAAALSWPDEQPQDVQPWPRAQRMPLAIAGHRVQPWHLHALAEYGEATGTVIEPNSGIGAGYTAAQVNWAITWWNERAEAKQPQDERDARIAQLEREVRELNATKLDPYLDLRNEIAATMTDEWDLDEAEISILIKYVRWLAAGQPRDEGGYPVRRESYPLADAKAAQDERDGDVRAVAALAAADDDAELDRAASDLIARFADRIEALEARDAKGE